MDERRAEAIPSRLRELRSFYVLGWANWVLSAALLGLLIGNAFAERTDVGNRIAVIAGLQPAPILATLTMLVSVCLVALLRYRATRERERRRSDAARARSTGRLRRKLKAWEGFLAEVLGAGPVDVLVRPGESSVMWTERSQERPAVVLTTSFWTAAAGRTDDLRAGLAHEAGHIAARDVELFHRLLACQWALGVVGVFAVALRLALALGPLPAGLSTLAFFGMQITLGAAGVLACWSALVMARETQADAFAADVVGADHVTRFLLQVHRARDGERLRLTARLWRYLIQPDLGWRATLPALRGDVGARIEIQLGVAITATVTMGWWVATFLGLYEALHGYDIVMFVPVVAFLAVVAYSFGWWRAHDPGRRAKAVGRVARSALMLCLSAFLVVFSAVFLQLAVGGNLAGAQASLLEGLLATVAMGLIFAASLAILLLFGIAGHSLDSMRGRPAPSGGSALLAVACVSAPVGVAVLIAVFIAQRVGAPEQVLEFGLPVTVTVAGAAVSFLLHRLALARERLRSH